MARDIVVPADCPPMRLDQFVVAQVAGASRRRVRDFDLYLNGRRAKHAAPVRPGDVVTIPDSLVETAELVGSPEMGLPILFEDELLVAVDKPAGVQSVALRADETGTVANFLVGAFPETRRAGGALEGGLVHRLDEGTSGVLVAARTAAAYADLRQQFAAREVEKDYLALVEGNVEAPGRVVAPIAHDRHQPARMVACPDDRTAERLGARAAATEYTPVVRWSRETLVRVRMRSGVRHQVRVHLASIGHPIVGDALYGSGSAHRFVTRLALHASRVSARHPGHGERLEIESRLPADLDVALRQLRP